MIAQNIANMEDVTKIGLTTTEDIRATIRKLIIYIFITKLGDAGLNQIEMML